MSGQAQATTTASDAWAPPTFKFLSDVQALSAFDRQHRIVLLGGGVGSGKTILHGIDAILRSQHETDLKHAILTNTQKQLDAEVIPSIRDRFVAAGFERPVYDRTPPIAWQRDWDRREIPVPSFSKYRGILVAPTGYHAICGTLSNIRSINQFDTIEFGDARVEEAANNDRAAIDMVLERIRCGDGRSERCRRWHHHQAHLVFNPPRGAHPWLYTFLDELEESAKKFYHAVDGESCDCPRVHGPTLNHRNWPLLRRGIGEAVWYQSATADNYHLDSGYGERLAANMSKDTARRRLGGEIIRETEGGAYSSFSHDNIVPVRYDPDRTLWLGLDFNLQPRACVFAQQLNPGEYPTEHERAGLTHVGIFGEYFYAGEMADRDWAIDLVRGGRGDGCDMQPRYASEEWRGLPQSCDESCIETARAEYVAAHPEQPGRINRERDLARAIATCKKGHWNGLRGHRGRIIAFGDQRGTHRNSQTLESSWKIVGEVFQGLGRYGKDVPEIQPAPRARVDSVNGKLCNEFDLRSLWIDQRCEELLRDFEQVQWDDTGNALREWRRGNRGTEWFRTHLTDGLGYMIHRRFPQGHEDKWSPDIPKTHRKKRERIPSFI